MSIAEQELLAGNGWEQVSEGDTFLSSDCNHVGMICFESETFARCANCLAEWEKGAKDAG